MPDDTLEQRVRARMASIRANQLERTLRPPSGIDLSSNDYLGLSSHPRLKQAMADAVLRDGVGSTICAREGTVWITEENSAKDVVLENGACYRLDRPGLTLVQAFADASVSLN